MFTTLIATSALIALAIWGLAARLRHTLAGVDTDMRTMRYTVCDFEI